jgi:hypothetical protein
MTYTTTNLHDATPFASEAAARNAITAFRDAEMERDPFRVYGCDTISTRQGFFAVVWPAEGAKGEAGWLLEVTPEEAFRAAVTPGPANTTPANMADLLSRMDPAKLRDAVEQINDKETENGK